MEFQDRECLVARLVIGRVSFQLGQPYFLVNPTIEDKYDAHRIYQLKYDEARWGNMYDEDEFSYILHELGYWTIDDENRLVQIGKEIEEFKVKLFEMVFKTEARNKIRKALAVAKEEQGKMIERKHHYDNLTIQGFALSCKLRHLLLRRLRDAKLRRVKNSAYLTDRIVAAYNAQCLTESTIREIARTEPWRTVWMSKKDASVFNCHPYEMSDEQKMLFVWSSTYDNIYQAAECPADTVIEDDDMLDGWMIIQRRKRESDLAKKEGDSILTDKIRNAQEIFIPVDTPQDAERVNSLNTLEGKIKQQQRLNALKKKGKMEESEMPDSRARIMMEVNKAQKG